ncbi:MAG: DNA replication/repair protein RecF [Candidatus Krumholzibacteriota bacterium]|nr:DNA replication/repair protein RecF [Candidatus Krumholzibacteriota bacterium]
MIIKDIECVNFRNIEKASLEFSDTFNIIEGANAQGKTNLLEAAHVFSLGRGFRTRRTDELVRFGEEYFFLKLAGKSDNDVDFTIEFGYERGGKPRVSANGNRLSSLSGMIGIMPTVIFTPGDVELASGPPSQRRLFIDYTAAQISPAFLSDLGEFRRVLRHRNTLLRKISSGNGEKEELGAWDEIFIRKGAALTRGRIEVLRQIEEAAREIFERIRPAGEKLGARYRASSRVGKDSIEEDLREALGRNAGTEQKRGFTLTGPQYDDVDLLLDEVPLRRFGSQGRKRLVAVVLKLSQAVVIMERRGERPVVLLDDIFSELDAEISGKVRDLLSDRYQSLITSPRSGAFSPLPEGAAVFSVEKGSFRRLKQ